MNSIPEKRPRTVATFGDIHHLDHRNEFLRCYAKDASFVAAFEELEARHSDVWSDLDLDDWPNPPDGDWQALLSPISDDLPAVFATERYPTQWPEVLDIAKRRNAASITRYVEGLQSFAAQWGLTGLRSTVGIDWLYRGVGYNVVHQALLGRLDFPEHPVALQDHRAYEIPWVDGETPNWPAKITFTIPVAWPYETEKRSAFFERAYKEFRHALREQVQSAQFRLEATGYVFPPDASPLEQHLKWLYRRVAKREHVELIAAGESHPGDGRQQPPERYVRNRTDELAKVIGVKIPRSPRRR